MSFTRPRYDPCAYSKELDESTSTLNYMLDPNKHYSCNECRVDFGIVGGNNVSRIDGNMVDLESDLRNQTRLYSKCPAKKYLPQCKPNCTTSQTGLPCGSRSCQTTPLYHLPTCKMIHYKPRIDNIGYEINYPACPPPQEPKKRPYMSKKEFNQQCGPVQNPTSDWEIRDWNSKYAPSNFTK